MAVQLNTAIQINGAVTASTDTEITITATEMLLGGSYVKFTPDKVITLAVTDYSESELSKSELAVAKVLAAKGGTAVQLNDAQKVAAASLDSKVK